MVNFISQQLNCVLINHLKLVNTVLKILTLLVEIFTVLLWIRQILNQFSKSRVIGSI